MTNAEVLRVEGLAKDYELGRQRISVLRDLSLRASAGEMVAVMGPSGSGKTTLLNCISGVDSADGGRIIVRGMDVTASSERERTLMRRQHIGMVFQFFNLIPSLTVRENIALPFLVMGDRRKESDSRVAQLIEQVGLAGRESHRSFQLSGGEMQLVSIARALVHRPALLLADEPTGNVNPAVGRSILKILTATASEQGSAILMVTHSPEHAAWADRVCFLRDGVIVAEREHGRDRDDVSAIYATLLDLGI